MGISGKSIGNNCDVWLKIYAETRITEPSNRFKSNFACQHPLSAEALHRGLDGSGCPTPLPLIYAPATMTNSCIGLWWLFSRKNRKSQS